MHDLDYRAALQDFTKFLESLSQKVGEFDETIPELPVKDLVSFKPPRPKGKKKMLTDSRSFASIEVRIQMKDL